jgi:hypothetical protein
LGIHNTHSIGGESLDRFLALYDMWVGGRMHGRLALPDPKTGQTLRENDIII